MNIGIKPRELPELRQELIEWLRTNSSYTWLTGLKRGFRQNGPQHWERFQILGWNLESSISDEELVASLAAEGQERLERAELYFVTAEMTQLAIHAAMSLPNFRLCPEDLSSDYGFVVWEEPITVTPERESLTEAGDPFVAVVWGRYRDNEVWVSCFSDAMAAGHHIQRRYGHDERLMARYRKLYGRCRLVWGSEDRISFEPGGGNWPMEHYDEPGASRRREELMDRAQMERVLVATWLLMSQEFAAETQAHAERAARRRLQRLNVTPQPVRLITLRRPRRPRAQVENQEESAARVYRHSWIVRGHWCNQWYPSRRDHKPLWIAPHVAGPEAAPLIGAERVNILRR